MKNVKRCSTCNRPATEVWMDADTGPWLYCTQHANESRQYDSDHPDMVTEGRWAPIVDALDQLV